MRVLYCIRHCVVGTLMLYACSIDAYGQTLDQAFFSLQNALSLLSDPGKQESRRLPAHEISKLRTTINALQALSTELTSEDEALYAKSLLHDASLMRLAAQESDTAKATLLLADVNADLKIKSTRKAGMGMTSRFNGKVAVSVNTRRADSTVGGYVIVLNPLHYTASEPFARFAKLSSPSVGAVPPGRYVLIANRDGSEVRREVVTIGLDAQDTVALDFQVP